MSNSTAGEQVAGLLREKILTGEIPDSIELTQTWIADQLGVSRMPIREALSSLEFEGYIERLDNRHTRVIGSDGQTLHSRIRYIKLLETEAVRCIIDNSSSRELAEYLSDLTDNGSADEELFHYTLFRGSEDRYLNQVFRKIIKPTLVVLIRISTVGKEDTALQLKRIARAVKSENMEKVEKSLDLYFSEMLRGIDV